MDIYQLAKRTFPINITMLNSHKTVQELKRDAFVKGYKAATTWYSMEEAPKNNWIGIMDEERGFVVCEWGDPSGGWWLKGAHATADKPLAWTHLPVYKP